MQTDESPSTSSVGLASLVATLQTLTFLSMPTEANLSPSLLNVRYYAANLSCQSFSNITFHNISKNDRGIILIHKCDKIAPRANGTNRF